MRCFKEFSLPVLSPSWMFQRLLHAAQPDLRGVPSGQLHGAGQRHVLHGLPIGIIHPHHCQSQRIQLQRYRVSLMIPMQSGGIERAEIHAFPDIQLRIVAINGLKESCGFMSDTSVKIVE